MKKITLYCAVCKRESVFSATSHEDDEEGSELECCPWCLAPKTNVASKEEVAEQAVAKEREVKLDELLDPKPENEGGA